jgi:hypothetical protein
LPFRSVLLLPPLIQLSLHGLQGVPGVLLCRRRSMRGRRRCWCRWCRNDLLRRRRASDLALQQSEVALVLPDVEVDGVRSGVGGNRVLLLGWLRLRRGRARLLLLLGRYGLACDESPDPSESLDVLRRSPQPLEADLEYPRGGVLDLRSARSGTGPHRRLDGRSRRVGRFRRERRDRRLSRGGFGACRTGPHHVVLDSSTRWAPNCWWKSGPKGGRRHNSPLSSIFPFACYYEATSTIRARKGKVETLNSTGNETRRYSADRRPKD